MSAAANKCENVHKRAPRTVMPPDWMCAGNPAKDGVADQDPSSGCLDRKVSQIRIPDQDVSAGWGCRPGWDIVLGRLRATIRPSR